MLRCDLKKKLSLTFSEKTSKVKGKVDYDLKSGDPSYSAFPTVDSRIMEKLVVNEVKSQKFVEK